ncbi:NAD(P)H dehydrogenase [Sphingobium sp. SCG-1]|uniref:FMN-dependent NADH-azoreductase n=1 Tax=Sphingobium sp. SCG-1 TaxID=2072936 RepID=UPI000CD67DEF|nr:NAD(P)H-dependent oxidoreductase [Sphingobium sp. SCG-1]AUW59557.1 NAD(P)H dehydrogenase [Sphingobium sp. SCG-1]
MSRFARLLHIEASPRGPRSRSSDVARRLIDGIAPATVETLNLFEADLPPFDGTVIEGRYALLAGDAVSPDVVAQWDAIRARIDHFLSFDAWLFSAPMWNFGVPYPLKHYIDLITHPGMTFTVQDGGVTGLAAGRTAIVIGSGALDIRPDGPMAALDHQMTYLNDWVGFIGVTDIHRVDIRPTYGSECEVSAAMDRAYAEADALAAALSRPARV